MDLSYTTQEIFELGENVRKRDSFTLQQDDRRISIRCKSEIESTLDSDELNSHSQVPLSGKPSATEFRESR